MKLTAEELRTCEEHYKTNPVVTKDMMGEIAMSLPYDEIGLGSKRIFWEGRALEIIPKSQLLPCLQRILLYKQQNAPKEKTLQELEKERLLNFESYREEILKKYRGCRVFKASDKLNTCGPGNVRGELPDDRLGKKMALQRTQNWHFVRYQGEAACVQLSPSSSPSDGLNQGIYTSSIGGCSAVAVLYGNNVAGYQGKHFALAALGHLAGSDPKSIDWRHMKPLGWNPTMATDPNRTVYSVVFADSAHSASHAIDAVKTNIGLANIQIIVYLSDELSMCGVDTQGRFGITY